MQRREALKLIQDDMDKHNLKEVSYLTDGRTYMNVTAKSTNGEFYRYCHDALCTVIRKYKLIVDINSQQIIGHIDTGKRGKNE